MENMSQDMVESLEKVKVKAMMNLVAFRSLLLEVGKDEVLPAEFHYYWSDLLLNGDKNTAIQGFRESAKTQYALRAFLLYSLVFPSGKRDYIVLIKNNATLASAKLKEIEREYVASPLLKANIIKIHEQSGLVFSVDVKDVFGDTINVRIEAYGKGASIRGLASIDRRPRICIIDDPQDIEDAQSETTQEADWTWFLSDIMFLGQHTRIFLIGNNLGERCIIEKVFANVDELKFEPHKVPAITNGVSSWPQKYTLEAIEKEKESYQRLGKLDIWFREKMCECIADEIRVFKREDFRYFSPFASMKIMGECNVYIRTDLGISEKKSADYSVINVIGVNSENNWFILDCVYGRFDASTFIDELFKAVARWSPKNVGIEKVAFQSVMEQFINKEMSKRNIFFNIVEEKADKQKELRIKALQSRFKAHTIWFPNQSGWLAEMEAELLMFPKGAHDDLIDALAYMEQETRTPFGGSRRIRMQDLPRQGEMNLR